MFSILQECSIQELDDLEVYWINELKSYVGFPDCNGYNETLGGDGNKRIALDDIRFVCELFNSGFGTVLDISRYLNYSPNRVRRYLKIGNDNNLCNYNADIENSKSHSVKVVCLNTRKIFNSITEAEQYYNVFSISACCNKKIKYAGKDDAGNFLLWMYYDEYILLSDNDISKIINETLFSIYSSYVVCLNTGKIYVNARNAICDYDFKSAGPIYNCCKGKQLYGGVDKQTKQKLVWAYYNDYKKMSNDDINNKLLLVNKK